MNWTKEIPEEPGYYFIDHYDEELMVEVVITKEGPCFVEFFGNGNLINCMEMENADWLGPIKSVDIINLWRNFDEKENIEKDIVYGRMEDCYLLKENEKKKKNGL